MATIYDVPTNDLLEEVAKDLQQVDEIKPPSWASFVKTGISRERPPVREDWWYVRSAAILRKVRLLGPVGTSKLRTKFGGRKRYGHAGQHFARASGNIIRKCLQQLEAAGLVEKKAKGVHKGRVVTPQGMAFMDKAASRIYTPVSKKVNASKEKASKENKSEKTSEKKPEAQVKSEKKQESKEAKTEKKEEKKKPEADKKENKEAKKEKSAKEEPGEKPE